MPSTPSTCLAGSAYVSGNKIYLATTDVYLRDHRGHIAQVTDFTDLATAYHDPVEEVLYQDRLLPVPTSRDFTHPGAGQRVAPVTAVHHGAVGRRLAQRDQVRRAKSHVLGVIEAPAPGPKMRLGDAAAVLDVRAVGMDHVWVNEETRTLSIGLDSDSAPANQARLALTTATSQGITVVPIIPRPLTLWNTSLSEASRDAYRRLRHQPAKNTLLDGPMIVHPESRAAIRSAGAQALGLVLAVPTAIAASVLAVVNILTAPARDNSGRWGVDAHFAGVPGVVDWPLTGHRLRVVQAVRPFADPSLALVERQRQITESQEAVHRAIETTLATRRRAGQVTRAQAQAQTSRYQRIVAAHVSASRYCLINGEKVSDALGWLQYEAGPAQYVRWLDELTQ